VSRHRELRVYGTTSFRSACPPAPNGSHQTREIIAAHSKTAAKRLAGWDVALSEVCETGNEEELATAMAAPGVLFWSPLNARLPRTWTRVEVKAR
jgi:hypothetical protein